MRLIAAAMSLAAVGAAAIAWAQSPPPAAPLVVTRAGAIASEKGAAETFTGQVRADNRFQAPAPARVGGATVTFEPGARTHWHTHPLGQILIVTAGRGFVQNDGGPVQEIRVGDQVWTAPGVKHWHGASPTTAMSHIAIAERVDGVGANWMEPVSEAQYAKGPR